MGDKVKEFKFPKRFLWGVATAAHQVEGNTHNNWSVWELENAKSLAKSAEYKLKHLEIWPEIKKLATSPENYVSGRAIDHYNRYEQDFDIVKKMNLNAFRFSIEWSRIEPEEGVWSAEAIDHYRKYIKAMKDRGIEPMVTLYHWTVPVWFSKKGAFERADNVKYFVRFAEKILQEFGKDLRYITTINEPDTVVAMGYWFQDHPPQKHSLVRAFWVYRNHLKAHKDVYKMARKISRRFKVGFVKSYAHIESGDDRFSSRMMARADRFLRDDLVLGYVGNKLDFIGVNYYFSDRYVGWKISDGANTYFTDSKGEAGSNKDVYETSDLGWGMKSENLEFVLKRLGRHKKPIFVTETGVADRNDVYRKQWLNGTIRSVHVAIEAGVDVQGYMHWSLFDNFEWAYGRWPCFGLIEIDYEDDLKRVPRKRAHYYATFVKKARGL